MVDLAKAGFYGTEASRDGTVVLLLTHICNPATQKSRQEDCHDSEASLDYTVTSRAYWAIV